MTKKIFNIKETTEYVGLSRVSVWRLIKEGRFPEPLHTSEKNRAWLISELDAWIEERAKERAA